MNLRELVVKNITVSIDGETYRNARIAAAERNSSVSRLVRDYLRSLGTERTTGSEGTARLFAVLDTAKGFRVGNRLNREEAHAR